MTTPRVTELPRRLEPSSRDTFLGSSAADDHAPLAAVVQLRPGAPLTARRSSKRHRLAQSFAVAPAGGPGNSAA